LTLVAIDQSTDTWRGIQARIQGPRSRRWVLIGAAVMIVLGVFWFRTPEEAGQQEMYLYVARTDRPSSEALELTLKESP
jgi:hypothetical protein